MGRKTIWWDVTFPLVAPGYQWRATDYRIRNQSRNLMAENGGYVRVKLRGGRRVAVSKMMLIAASVLGLPPLRWCQSCGERVGLFGRG